METGWRYARDDLRSKEHGLTERALEYFREIHLDGRSLLRWLLLHLLNVSLFDLLH